MDLKKHIVNVVDWPKRGVLHRDFMPIIANPEIFETVVNEFSAYYANKEIDKIVGIESRGFIIATALARALNLPLVLVRKMGKLPPQTISQEYDLEYNSDKLEIQTAAITNGDKVLIVDDQLATGGTAFAAIQLVERLQGSVIGLAFLIYQSKFEGVKQLSKYDVYFLTEFKDRLSEASKYSILGSRFRILEYQGVEAIEKKISLNKKFQPVQDKITVCFEKYFESMVSAGMPFPKIMNRHVAKDTYHFTCEFKGKNVLQSHQKDITSFLDNADLMGQVLGILKIAQEKGVCLDPHIKNFVTDSDGKVYYVDFSPPCVEEYFSLRLSLCSEEKELMMQNFEYLKPAKLGYHFAGDLMKTDDAFMARMPELFKMMKERNIVNGDYEYFLSEANKIIKIERERDKRGIFLL
tara:strand:- start:23332 stop:24558 length:1227 start_codon:yes stop_codon:yes gene_type:complete